MFQVQSFADRLKGDRSSLVYLVKADSTGGRAWFFVEIEKLKKEVFLKAVKQDEFDLTKYGKVLYSGYGEQPSSDIIKKLEEDYNSEAAV